MTATFDQLRAQLVAKVRQVNRDRREAAAVKSNCVHQKKRYRQSIIPDNARFHGAAYFIVDACVKCKRKELITLVVEGVRSPAAGLEPVNDLAQ